MAPKRKAAKPLVEEGPPDRYVIISKESRQWLVSQIWSDLRVWYAVEDLEKSALAQGDLDAEFRVVLEEEYYSGMMKPLKRPKNLPPREALTAKVVSLSSSVGSVPAPTIPATIKVEKKKEIPDLPGGFDDWMKGVGK